ncbi:lysylphosphatidylglycerol synthase transmembrane domain-containing protein [Halorhabdus amylolytica]|uniref:lysylphosphatidylglycerol synthase transmembrane domain-containing protein n=1 Tax=Halorhabdus amylolytica TaxID=2559573 RepID=UPI0010AACA56|nr:lysylphosphatidylglycerol synthase transmembrane domain-containing protein [Halorhabdus amylolytica]
MNGDRRATIAGFAGAVLVLAVLFWFVGMGEIVRTLRRAEPPVLIAVVGFSGLWLVSWGMSLHTVLGALGHSIKARSAILVFSAAVFSNNVTPFGQAGGEPVSALLISEVTDSDYETGLAAIASVDTLHFVPSIGLATVGLGTFAIRTVSLGRNLLFASIAVGALAGVFLAGVLAGWRYRYEIERFVVRLFTPAIRRLWDVLPRLDPPTREDIEEGIEGFFCSIDRVASSRRTILRASLYSTLGWLSLSMALWLSLAAIGYVVPFVATLVVVPVASIAAITPLPGGLGGIETAFIALLVSTTGVAASVAGAAIVIYRVATYWLPIVLGGAVAATLGARRQRP